MSTPFQRVRTSATAAETSGACDRSQRRVSTSTPCSRHSVAVAASPTTSISTRKSCAPSFASRNAIARPIPEAAPVISAFLFRISRILTPQKPGRILSRELKRAGDPCRRLAYVGEFLARLSLSKSETRNSVANARPALRSRPLQLLHRQRLARRNNARKYARLQIGRRNRSAQPQLVIAAQQGRAPLVQVILAAVVHAAVVLLVRVGRHM